MKKPKSMKQYICKNCNAIHSRWSGKCPSCEAWNSLEEFSHPQEPLGNIHKSQKTYKDPIALPQVPSQPEERISTRWEELDLVLGGGMVPGSLVLIGGEPGVGKSTLVLEIARNLTKDNPKKVLYISGEESAQQISLRAKRLKIQEENIFISSEVILENTIQMIVDLKPQAVFIDSIQTIRKESIPSHAGSVTQLKECTQAYLSIAKYFGIPIFLIGHITKDGQIAGPKLLEHLVDTVLYFEGDKWNYYRILRCTKNRFGAVGEIAVFEMTGSGLKEVKKKSEIFIPNLSIPQEGTVLSAVMEGSRALTVEVQALVTPSGLANARRMSEGLDNKRLVLICAVLEKYFQIPLSKWDVFANLAGGLYIDEPALDLAIAAAILSSYRNLSIPRNIAFIGEVGLSGEVRGVAQTNLRFKELLGLGMEKVVTSKSGKQDATTPVGLEVVAIHNIKELEPILESN